MYKIPPVNIVLQTLFYGIFILLLMLPFALEGNTFENIEVNYIDNDHHVSIAGKKVGNHYTFNSNSKKILRLATLNWPPYINEEQCNMGWVFQLTVAMLVSKGYQVRIQFLPWKRAVRVVELGDHDILFPEYFFDETVYSQNLENTRRRTITALSDHFDGGLLRLVKRRGVDDPFRGDLSILKNNIFGVVRGYQNTPVFDQMVANGQLKTIEAGDELQLVKMLLAKRVDYIVVDPKVLDYVIKHSSLTKIQKVRMLTGIENVEPALQYNYLYYAISKKSSRWLEIQQDINAALATFKGNAEIQRMIKTNEQCAERIYN